MIFKLGQYLKNHKHFFISKILLEDCISREKTFHLLSAWAKVIWRLDWAITSKMAGRSAQLGAQQLALLEPFMNWLLSSWWLDGSGKNSINVFKHSYRNHTVSFLLHFLDQNTLRDQPRWALPLDGLMVTLSTTKNTEKQIKDRWITTFQLKFWGARYW